LQTTTELASNHPEVALRDEAARRLRHIATDTFLRALLVRRSRHVAASAGAKGWPPNLTFSTAAQKSSNAHERKWSNSLFDKPFYEEVIFNFVQLQLRE